MSDVGHIWLPEELASTRCPPGPETCTSCAHVSCALLPQDLPPSKGRLHQDQVLRRAPRLRQGVPSWRPICSTGSAWSPAPCLAWLSVMQAGGKSCCCLVGLSDGPLPPQHLQVTLKSKKCFTTEKISYAAMSYGDEKKEHVCKDNKCATDGQSTLLHIQVLHAGFQGSLS
jgi:hypothetical protein